jgi:hypothetical protein
MAIEIKRSTAPEVSRGFHTACADVGAGEKFVIHGGEGEWPMAGDTTAISLTGLMERLSGDG